MLNIFWCYLIFLCNLQLQWLSFSIANHQLSDWLVISTLGLIFKWNKFKLPDQLHQLQQLNANDSTTNNEHSQQYCVSTLLLPYSRKPYVPL